MKPIDIVILTDQDHLSSQNSKGEKNLGFIEDSILKESLEQEGCNVIRLAWDDSNFDWSSAKALIFRSTWNYFYHYSEFSSWLKIVSKQTTLLNSRSLIFWNIDKHYLSDFKENGVHIAESFFIEKGSKSTLKELQPGSRLVRNCFEALYLRYSKTYIQIK